MSASIIPAALWAIFHSFLHGFHIASLNGVQDAVTCNISGSSMGLRRCLDLTPSEFGVIVTIYTLGGLLGSLSADAVTRRLGRVGTLRIAEACFIIGTIGVGLANAMWIMAAARVIIGLGSGLSLVTVPILLSEISTRSSKTLFGTLHQMSIGIGMIFAQSLSFVFAKPWVWRYVLLIGFSIASALSIISLTLPALRKQKSENIEEQDEDDERRPLVEREEVKEEIGVKDLLHAESVIKRGMFIVIAAQFGQQICGISPVMYFSTSTLAPVFQDNSKLVALAVMAIGIPFNFVPGLLPQSIGSKRLLIVSSLGTAICALTLGIGLNIHNRILSGISIILFVISFSVGLAPIPWVVLSEVVPTEARTAVGAVAVSINWLINFSAGSVFLPLQQLLKRGNEGQGNVFFVFAAASAVSMGLIFSAYRTYAKVKQ